MGFFDTISNKINSLMKDLGKFVYEHWFIYIIVVLAVVLGGVLSAIFGWFFAVVVPLFILWVGFIAKNRYKRTVKPLLILQSRNPLTSEKFYISFSRGSLIFYW